MRKFEPMSYMVIVESGATKGDWRIMDRSGAEIKRFLRGGTNVSTMRMEEIKKTLVEAISSEGLKDAEGLYLYTAGVVTKAISEELTAFLRSLCPVADIDIQDDLVGAARGACGHSPGIAAILGTGSNACFYDGEAIHQKVYSGGYIIGDDGSAATLGKLFLTDFIKGLVPMDISEDFAMQFDASYAAIVEGVYRSASPSGYLGSLAPFIIRHYGHPYVKDLVDRNFLSFIDRSLLRYDTASYPLGIVGGFGWACKEIFRPLCEKAGIRISRFVKAPIEGLCEYHREGFPI